MRAGTVLTELVEFSDGFPDADISWELLDSTGTQVATGTVTPEADSVSAVITVPADKNSLEAGVLASPRELSWAYTVGGLVHTGRRRYRLEAFLPYGVSPEGVRDKLGLEPHELEDDDIDLVSAYVTFVSKVTPENLDAAAEIAVGNAIEALAALVALSSLQIKLATKQSSGTDQFQRGKIDWGAIRGQLEAIVATGYLTVDPLIDETATFGALVVPVVRDDPVTNTTP